jgi:chemotaxis family two-component system sensor kinase Cph1
VTAPPDLASCDREPIHIPGSIQPHGVLLAVEEPSLRVVLASANLRESLGPSPDDAVGQPLAAVLGDGARDLAEALEDVGLEPRFVGAVQAGAAGARFEVVAHRVDGLLVLELEPAPDDRAGGFRRLSAEVGAFLRRAPATSGVEELCDLAAREVRRITGFDRVLVYRFDPSWNGQVVAEDRSDAYPTLLDHWFPDTDIPAQARELYRRNRWRLIPDAGYTPVPLVPGLNPLTGRPLDLTHAGLRSVSPVHVEYLRNMGVTASMSLSILHEGRLWGLVSGHHRTPRRLSFEVRAACDFLGHLLSLQLAGRERTAEYEHRIHLKSAQSRLLAAMAREEPFIRGLLLDPGELLDFAGADGAAVLNAGECTLVGATPSEAEVQELVDWLLEHGREDVFHTDALPSLFAGADRLRDRACGLLAIPLSTLHRSYVLWFRGEVLQTVRWGGDPTKSLEPDPASGRLHPRRSFETWQETVRGRSLPWRPSEIAAAGELRHSIVAVVLRKAEELAEVSAELTRSNRELEAFSYSVSHDLRAPFRHIVGYSELLRERLQDRADDRIARYLDTIVESAHFAGTLVDNLLSFSQIGRASLHFTAVDMALLVDEVCRDVMSEADGRQVGWRIAPLPSIVGDLMMLRQVWRNLLSNAVKYTRGREESRIEVWSEPGDSETLFAVRDNGVGFEMQYVDKLFGVFQRLHRMEEFEGTGIGLANVRRIVSRHGGRTWAVGSVGQGATFFFTLPHRQPMEAH